MKTITNRIALFAASAIVLGTMAYGQTRVMKADIPFAFHTSNADLAAGSYYLTNQTNPSGTNIVILRSTTSKNAAAILTSAPKDYYAKGSNALLFRCSGQSCALSGIRTPDGTYSYNSGHNSKRDREVAIVAVTSPSVKAD